MRKWRTAVKADYLQGLCLADIEMCDEPIWHRMAEVAESYDGIQPDEAGLPLDWIVEDVLQEPEILLLVGPRMRGAGGGGNRTPKPNNGSTKAPPGVSAAAKKAKRVKKKAAQKVRNGESAAYRQEKGQTQPGGKAGGKGGKGGKAPAQLALPPPGGKGDRRSNMPIPLVGMNRLCKDGHSGKCYAYNLNDYSKASDTCKGTQPGQKCDRGYHMCMNLGCDDQAHALKVQHGSG